MVKLLDPLRIPDAIKTGPFISLFVVHEVLDQAAYREYQAISDGQSLKPHEFGGQVLGFSKPVFRLLGPENAHAVAVIRWPNLDSFKAWRTQEVYSRPGVAELHDRAERETVYFLPALER